MKSAKIALVALSLSSALASALALEPVKFEVGATAKPSAPLSVTPPGGVGKVQVDVLPPHLEGVVSLDEFRTYVNYQFAVRENPEVNTLTAKALELSKALREVQVQLDAARKRAAESNPEWKAAEAIGEKIREAARRRAVSAGK